MAHLLGTPVLSLRLEEAINILSSTLTPFFQHSTVAVNAGNPLAFLAQPEQGTELLGQALLRLGVLLDDSTVWHDGSNHPAVAAISTTGLLEVHGEMLDACFAATTAVLSSKAYNDNATHPYNFLLFTAFQMLQAWTSQWPPQHLLRHPRRLASLDVLLAQTAKLSSSVEYLEPDRYKLMTAVAKFSDELLTSILQLPPAEIPGILGAFPSTLFPHILTLVDKQLRRLAKDPLFGCIHSIITKLQQLASITPHHNITANTIFTPALIGFAKHVLVTTVCKTLPSPDPSQPGRFHPLDSALYLLFQSGSLLLAGAAGLKQNQSSGRRSHVAPLQQPSVSDHEYFRALCHCNNSDKISGTPRSYLYICSLIHDEITSWRNKADTIMLGNLELPEVPSMLLFLGRRAQSLLQAKRHVRLPTQSSCPSLPQRVLDAIQVTMQALLIDICHMATKISGVGVEARKTDGYVALYPQSVPSSCLKMNVDTWMAVPGSAATVEAILRDGLRGPPFINQYDAACTALAILLAPFEKTHSAVPQRISLAATLRKLMHPASALLWASALYPSTVWQPAGKCSRSDYEECCLVLFCLARRHVCVLTDPQFAHAARRATASNRPCNQPVLNPICSTPSALAKHDFTLSCVRSDTSAGSKKTESRGSVLSSPSRSILETSQSLCNQESMKVLQTILAATHVQLCKCSGNESIGMEGYKDVPDVLSDTAIQLLQTKRKAGRGSSRLVEEKKILARSWEAFACEYMTKRLLPGCSHWGCVNMDGPSESSLSTRLCSGCRRERYCSDECQKAAWVGGHKDLCSAAANKK